MDLDVYKRQYVHSHLKEQNELYELKYNLVKGTSDLTGVSEKLMKTIAAEGNQSLLEAH